MEYFEDELFLRHGRPNTEQEMHCYRLWFDFLKMKRSEREKWSESVASDFGDLNCEFDEWWPNHSYLFRHLKPFIINEINSEEDFQLYTDDGATARDIVVLAVNLGETKSALQSAFTEILLKYQEKRKAGRQPYNDELAYVRSFAARPDPDMLEKILAVYRLYTAEQQKPEKERLAPWQIEEKVSVSTTLILKEDEKAEYLWSMPAEEVTPDVIKRRRKSQHTTVMRYVKYAEEILENVVVGKFPVYTMSKSKTNTPPEAADK